jgi:acyl-CoA synthetase (AMP-forming)/AMP-acid ligase II/aryl carrier-like protein
MTGRATTLSELLAENSASHGSAPALLDVSGAAVSHADLYRTAVDMRTQLLALGLEPGCRVGLVTPRGPEGLVAFLGVAGLGAAAPMNPASRLEEFEAAITLLKLDAMVCVQAGSKAVLAAQRAGVAAIEGEWSVANGAVWHLRACGQAHANAQPSSHALERAPGDIVLLMQTSGSTGKPKVVPISHANVLAAARGIVGAFDLRPGDRCLNVMPLFHVHGLLSAGVSSIAGGASVVCTPAFDAARLPAWLANTASTWFTASPTMHFAALDHAVRGGRAPRHPGLRFVRSSSAPLSSTKIAALEELYGAPLIETYGLTETASLITSNPLPPGCRKPGSVGVAIGADIAIADEGGRILTEPGRSGEIVISGPSVVSGYEASEEVNRASFRGKWLRTGDGGHLDADGYLFVTHRLKEVVKRGGEQVMLAEIDHVLNGHPAVHVAVAFTVAHKTLGEEVVAAVQLKPGQTASARELKVHVMGTLATYKVPSGIFFVDNFPRNAAGKIVRRELAKLATRECAAADAPGGLEGSLLAAWRSVIQASDLGPRDNVFLAGADPIRAKEILQLIESEWHVQLKFKDLLLAPTVAEQAQLLQGAQRT